MIHFVFGLKPDFGHHEFSFVHYLAVVTAWAVNRPERILFHYQYEPSGPWWDRARRYLELNPVEAPARIFDRPVDHFAHRADVIRLERLIEQGGIYLDMDVVCVNPFTPLLGNDCVLAEEPEAGLCNAVILARPGARFLQRWYDEYRDFDQSQWDEHSVQRPRILAERFPQELTVRPQTDFFFPLYSDPPQVLWGSRAQALADPENRRRIGRRLKRQSWKLARLKAPKRVYPPLARFFRSQAYFWPAVRDARCMHLWEQSWWQPYLKHIDADFIVNGDTNFARAIRHALAGSEALDELRTVAADSATTTARA